MIPEDAAIKLDSLMSDFGFASNRRVFEFVVNGVEFLYPAIEMAILHQHKKPKEKRQRLLFRLWYVILL